MVVMSALGSQDVNEGNEADGVTEIKMELPFNIVNMSSYECQRKGKMSDGGELATEDGGLSSTGIVELPSVQKLGCKVRSDTKSGSPNSDEPSTPVDPILVSGIMPCT